MLYYPPSTRTPRTRDSVGFNGYVSSQGQINSVALTVRIMAQDNRKMPSQHIGNTVLVVTMEVDEADEAEFNKWYNEQHLPERMAIPGYISARRFKLKGDNNNK